MKPNSAKRGISTSKCFHQLREGCKQSQVKNCNYLYGHQYMLIEKRNTSTMRGLASVPSGPSRMYCKGPGEVRHKSLNQFFSPENISRRTAKVHVPPKSEPGNVHTGDAVSIAIKRGRFFNCLFVESSHHKHCLRFPLGVLLCFGTSDIWCTFF